MKSIFRESLKESDLQNELTVIIEETFENAQAIFKSRGGKILKMIEYENKKSSTKLIQ